MRPHVDRDLGRVTALTLAMLLGPAALHGSAQAEDANTAKAAFERGTKSYNMAEFDRALEAYKDAYRLKADPVLLFNIAQCHRMLGHIDEAIAVYRAYLREAPGAKNRADVEKRIEELQAQRSGGSGAGALMGAATKPASGPQPELAPKPPEPKPAALDVSSAQAPGSAREASLESDLAASSSPFYTRWWFWTAVGAVAAGATIGILATRNPTQIPSSSLGSQKVLP